MKMLSNEQTNVSDDSHYFKEKRLDFRRKRKEREKGRDRSGERRRIERKIEREG